MSEHKLKLKDGRQLSYAEYGDSNGRPVLFFHGSPGSRFQGELYDELTKSKALQLFVLERPGYGNSSSKPNRTLIDWVEDVSEFMKDKSFDHVDVIGVSGGGPYALACSALLDKHVLRTIVVSGMGQVDSEEGRNHLSQEEQMLIQAAQYAPEKLATQIAHIHESPETLVAGATEHLPEFDRALIKPETVGKYLKSLKEATKSAEGMISDYTIFAQAWGFHPGDIHVPVTFIHGSEDTTVSIELSKKLVGLIDNAKLQVIDGAGHLGGSIEGSRQALLLLAD